MEISNVIVKPYLTEKSYIKRSEECKKYAFIVNIKADKNAIALAFENIFNLKPIKISTMIRKSVETKTGTAHPGMTKAFKIAYISLPKGKDIAISKEEVEEKSSKMKVNKNIKEAKEIKVETKEKVEQKKEKNINATKDVKKDVKG